MVKGKLKRQELGWVVVVGGMMVRGWREGLQDEVRCPTLQIECVTSRISQNLELTTTPTNTEERRCKRDACAPCCGFCGGQRLQS
jgi:hypothetical protein